MRSPLPLTLLLPILACEGPASAPPATSPAPSAASASGALRVAPSAAPTSSAFPSSAAVGSGDPIRVVDVGFQTPESITHDVDADVYLVANINGSPLGADDNGFISRVAPDGKVLELKWIDGAKEAATLDAPKGTTISGDMLYVADLTVVRKFDRKTGEPKGEIAIPGATFVNDLATGHDGTVYVSDSGTKAGKEGFEASGTDAIWRIGNDGKATPLLKDQSLGRPNGLFVTSEAVWCVTLGSGELFSVSLEEKAKKGGAVKLPKGSLDGIVGIGGGRVLISSWEGSLVYRGPLAGPFEPVITGVDAPADIGWDAKRKRALVPLFKKNAIEIHAVP